MAKFKKKKDPHAEREAQKYENPIPSREFILEHLAERGKPATYYELRDEFELHTENTEEALRRRLIAMVRDGQLLKNRKGAYGAAASMELIAGRIIGHKDGFGFIVPDDGGEDLFVSPRQMRLVFHGDRVLARVSSVDTRGRREAMIVEVLERGTQQLVGRFFSEAGAAYVEPSNQRVTQRILIPPDDIKQAKHGQMVVVAITTQPTKHALPLGEVVEVLGDHMAPGMEINVAIRNHEIPTYWPDDVLLEASRFGATVTEEAIQGRTDFRQLPFVTIDGDDAKDFDDAVYCIPRDKGGWMLYVAIADVSYYVKPNSALDKEAYNRGNSVYFPGRVIRSEERRVGKECRITGVDLGGRRIIQAEDGIRDSSVRDWSSDVCSSDLERLHYSRKSLLACQHAIFEVIYSAEDHRTAWEQIISVIEQEVEGIIVRAYDNIEMIIFISIFV